jgi:hypothetical protein
MNLSLLAIAHTAGGNCYSKMKLLAKLVAILTKDLTKQYKQ